VDRGHRAPTLIHQQDRDAIGGLDRDRVTGSVFDDGVGLTQDARASFGCDARRGVDLFDGGERVRQAAVTRTEAVDQPREGIELAGPVEVIRVEVEH
jgi:hypothetical protein